MDTSSNESFTWEEVSKESADNSSAASSPKCNDFKYNMSPKTVNGDLSPEKNSKKKSIKKEKESINDGEKRKIKIEPCSDNEAKKLKIKEENKIKSYNSTEHIDDEDKAFLNMKVKEECSSSDKYKTKKEKKRKHHSDYNSSDEFNCEVNEGSVKKTNRIKKEINSSIVWESEKALEEKQIKKRKKKGHSSQETESITLSFDDESQKAKKNKKNILNSGLEDINTPNNAVSQDISHDYDNELFENGTDIDDVNKSIETLKHNKKDSKIKKSKTTVSKNFTNAINEECVDIENITLSNSTSNLANNHATPRILDRIQFEDDVDSDIHHQSPKNLKEPFSLQINQFLKINPLLKPIANAVNNVSEITQNDEIWILKCPNEVDVVNFSDKDLSMDSKSKLKLNGETYYGILDNESSNIILISNEQDKYTMRNVKINGCISLKKKLRKPHFVEEVNNEIDCIPLPETKCRHPLFGSDYKKAIKIPSLICQHLAMETPKRKKKKKEIRSNDDVMEIEKPKLEAIDETPVKRAKKRKHSNDEGTAKKTKKIKKEINSSEVWESEKAIEENLFNF